MQRLYFVHRAVSRRLSTPSFRSASVFLFPNFILFFFLCNVPQVLGFWNYINCHALYFLYSHVSHCSNTSIYVIQSLDLFVLNILIYKTISAERKKVRDRHNINQRKSLILFRGIRHIDFSDQNFDHFASKGRQCISNRL